MRVRGCIYVFAFVLLFGLAICLIAGCGGTKTVFITVPSSQPSTQTTIPSSTSPASQPAKQEPLTGEPEKVVSKFIDAVNRGDFNAALGLWSTNTDDAADWFDRRNVSFTQTQVTGSGQTAYVSGTVKYIDDDGDREFDSYRFTLTKTGDTWTIMDDAD